MDGDVEGWVPVYVRVLQDHARGSGPRRRSRSLGALLSAGCPVPDGFVITARGYRDVTEGPGNSRLITERLVVRL
jgi:hypothetical protein